MMPGVIRGGDSPPSSNVSPKEVVNEEKPLASLSDADVKRIAVAIAKEVTHTVLGYLLGGFAAFLLWRLISSFI